MKTTKKVVLTIPNYYGAAVCLGDFSGLTMDEELEISRFLVNISNKYGSINFIYAFDIEDYPSQKNDVNDIPGTVSTVYLNPII
jgi:hypothetical protein